MRELTLSFFVRVMGLSLNLIREFSSYYIASFLVGLSLYLCEIFHKGINLYLLTSHRDVHFLWV